VHAAISYPVSANSITSDQSRRKSAELTNCPRAVMSGRNFVHLKINVVLPFIRCGAHISNIADGRGISSCRVRNRQA
jgi:hypothetical protein